MEIKELWAPPKESPQFFGFEGINLPGSSHRDQ